MSPEGVFVACRFVHFVALMLLFGQTAFVAFIATASPRRAGSAAVCAAASDQGHRRDGTDRQDFRSRLIASGRGLTLSAAVLTLLSAIAMVPIEAAQMGDGWGDALSSSCWLAVMGTAFGQVWQWHLALAAAALAVLCMVPAGRRSAASAAAVLAGLCLATLGLLGHAAMSEGLIGGIQRLNHALHLLSAAIWLGALPPLLPCLRALRDGLLRADAAQTLRRFSQTGHIAVAVVVLTGIVNTALVLRGWPIHLGMLYQALLDVKIALVLLMCCIALFNRYRLVPAMQHRPESALRALIVGTWCEIALGGVVLMLVSAFATFDPH